MERLSRRTRAVRLGRAFLMIVSFETKVLFDAIEGAVSDEVEEESWVRIIVMCD